MIQFKVIKSDTCGCCKPLVEKLGRYCDDNGYQMETVDISGVEDIPSDLSGLPYTIIIRDGMYVTSFQGDSPEDILKKRIEDLLERHKAIIDNVSD